jgi:hypothetical protein
VKLVGLLSGDFAFFQFTFDPAVLVGEPVIDLIAPRVAALPLRLGKSSRHGSADMANEITKATVFGKARMDFPFFSGRQETFDPCETLSWRC